MKRSQVTERFIMDTETSRKIVMDAWAAFASRDPARIGAVFAEDAPWPLLRKPYTLVALASAIEKAVKGG